MAQKTKGSRNKTRKKLTKHIRDKDTITSHLQEFEEGTKVNIKIDSSVHRGIPDPKFHGKTGEIVGKRGKAFIVEIDDLGKKKKIPVYPSHLKEAK